MMKFLFLGFILFLFFLVFCCLSVSGFVFDFCLLFSVAVVCAASAALMLLLSEVCLIASIAAMASDCFW